MGGRGGSGGGMKNANVGKNVGRSQRFKRSKRKSQGLGDDTPADITALNRWERSIRNRPEVDNFHQRWQNNPGFKAMNQLLDLIGGLLKTAGYSKVSRGGVREIANAIVNKRDPNLTLRNGAVHHEGGSTVIYDVL